MTAMLHCLVVEIADTIRAALPDRRVPTGDAADQRLVERLLAAGLLDDPPLIATLLRRADEERISLAASARSSRSGARLLQGLVGHDSGPVSAAAMALILARGRRRDRYGQCLLAFDDLDHDTATMLARRIAAALRAETGIENGDLVDAAARTIAAHEPAQSAAALTRALVNVLPAGDDILLAAASEGEVLLLAEALALKAGLPGAVAEEELLSGNTNALMLLFRLASLPRPVAAGILAAVGDLLGVRDPAAAMAQFESLADAALQAHHRLLSSPADYRAALAAMGADRG